MDEVKTGLTSQSQVGDKIFIWNTTQKMYGEELYSNPKCFQDAHKTTEERVIKGNAWSTNTHTQVFLMMHVKIMWKTEVEKKTNGDSYQYWSMLMLKIFEIPEAYCLVDGEDKWDWGTCQVHSYTSLCSTPGKCSQRKTMKPACKQKICNHY